jgi:SAM-dependent methyltransferase
MVSSNGTGAAMTTGDREALRTTFDSAAALYQDARPEYPAELVDELIAITGAGPGSRVLEVGCATGKATLPLARRGLQMTCVELGADLAATARRNLAGFPGVEIIVADFETWRPEATGTPEATGAPQPTGTPGERRFDLIVAANCWHWIDPAIRYRRARDLLRPGGRLAIFGQAHVFPAGGDRFFADIQDVYDEIGEGMPPGTGRPRPGELPDLRADIEASGLFGDVTVRHFDWEIRYDADGYLRLLDTFSGHIAMAAGKRARLYGEIRARLAERPDGLLRRHWGSVLQVARRLDAPRGPAGGVLRD